MNEPFRNAPDLDNEFEQASGPEMPEMEPASPNHWDEFEEHDEDLEHFDYEPPEMTYDPALDMEPTPFGTVFHEARQDLDHDANRAIDEALDREPEIDDQFADLRSHDDELQDDHEQGHHLLDQHSYQSWLRDQWDQDHEEDLELDR